MKTVTQVSSELGVSPKTIYKYINTTLHDELVPYVSEQKMKGKRISVISDEGIEVIRRSISVDLAGNDAEITGNEGIVTEEDHSVSGNDHGATIEDRKETGNNCSVTGKDRSVTGNERSVTEEDRKETGNDREVSGNDRAMTMLIGALQQQLVEKDKQITMLLEQNAAAQTEIKVQNESNRQLNNKLTGLIDNQQQISALDIRKQIAEAVESVRESEERTANKMIETPAKPSTGKSKKKHWWQKEEQGK